MKLQEWAVVFLKHQDIFKKEIKSVSEEAGKITLHKKADETWFVQEEADFSVDGNVVCLNTSGNFKKLLSAWTSLSEKQVKIVFANPRTNERWTIVPQHHARVADEKSFKAGLEAMFKSIAEA
jgi:ABC-type sulfate transport system substrate-binding protein